MNRSEYFDGTVWVEKDKKQWSPTVKLILAFILVFFGVNPSHSGHSLGNALARMRPAPTVFIQLPSGLGLYRPGDPGCFSLRRDLPKDVMGVRWMKPM